MICRFYYTVFFLLIFSIQLSASSRIENLDFTCISDIHNLSQHRLTCLYEDPQGFIWVGSRNSGIFRIEGNTVRQYQHAIDDSSSLFSNYVHAMCQGSGNDILISTLYGLNAIDISTGVSRRIALDGFLETEGCSSVFTVKRDDEGNYWLGTNCGFVILDENYVPFFQQKTAGGFEDRENYENTVHAIHHDAYDDDIVWLGTRYGLKSFNKKTKECLHFKHPPKWHDNNPEWQQFVMYEITQISPEEMWTTALWSGGIFRFNPIDKAWKQYLFPGSSKQNPSYGNSIYNIKEFDGDTMLYCNTIGCGFFNRVDGSFSHKTLYQPDGTVNWFAEVMIDRFGYLWYVNTNGLYKSNSMIKTSTSKAVPKVHAMTLNEARTFLPQMADITIPLDSNDIGIKFLTTNHPLADQEYYRWRLTPLESDWRSGQGARLLRYNNLPKGDYIFEYAVKDDTASDSWLAGQPQYIKIKASFYQSWWFKLLAVLAGVYTVFVLTRMQQRRKQKKEREVEQYERQLAEVKLSALNAQMNPHFLFNTMYSINHFILKNETKTASKYLTRFSRLIRQILNNSRKNLVTLKEELNAMKLYIEMEQLRFAFDFEFHINDSIDEENVMIPPMIFQPYIENAIWHGLLQKDARGKLEISIAVENKNMVIRILDDGIGRKASQASKRQRKYESNSFGMSIARERLELHGQLNATAANVEIVDHEDKGGQATGTEVLLTIPIVAPHIRH